MTKQHILIIVIAVICSFAGYMLIQNVSAPQLDAAANKNSVVNQAAIHKEKAFNAEEFTLANGMRVVLIENHRAPIVSHMMWYNIGAADEDWGNSGIAHFFEHLMFKGTKTLEPGEYSRTVRALGGNDNAFTSQDYTAYFVNIATENLAKIMRMEADRMVHLDIPEDHFLSERNVILEERAQRTDTNPAARLLETMRANLFPNHPYGIPVIGWRAEIAALAHQDAMDFYHKWYAPNNAILVVAGAISRAELEPLAQEIYGIIPAKTETVRPQYSAPVLPGDKLVSYEDGQVQQTQFIRLCRAPSYNTDKASSLALDIAANILDGGSATRLYKAIVSEKKLASAVSLSYSGFSRDESTLSLGAVPREGVSLTAVESAIDDELANYIATPPSAAEIREAKDRLINSAVFARDSLQSPAYIFGQALSTGLTMDDVEYWTYDIETVSDDAIKGAIKHLMTPDLCVSGRLLPKGGDPALRPQPEALTINTDQAMPVHGGSDE
jgi:zinc protease